MTPWDSSANTLGPGHLGGQAGALVLPPRPLGPQGTAEPSPWTLPPCQLFSAITPKQASFERRCWVSRENRERALGPGQEK